MFFFNLLLLFNYQKLKKFIKLIENSRIFNNFFFKKKIEYLILKSRWAYYRIWFPKKTKQNKEVKLRYVKKSQLNLYFLRRHKILLSRLKKQRRKYPLSYFCFVPTLHFLANNKLLDFIVAQPSLWVIKLIFREFLANSVYNQYFFNNKLKVYKKQPKIIFPFLQKLFSKKDISRLFNFLFINNVSFSKKFYLNVKRRQTHRLKKSRYLSKGLFSDFKKHITNYFVANKKKMFKTNSFFFILLFFSNLNFFISFLTKNLSGKKFFNNLLIHLRPFKYQPVIYLLSPHIRNNISYAKKLDFKKQNTQNKIIKFVTNLPNTFSSYLFRKINPPLRFLSKFTNNVDLMRSHNNPKLIKLRQLLEKTQLTTLNAKFVFSLLLNSNLRDKELISPSVNLVNINNNYLFYKSKKNNYYLTVTNYRGEALICCSGGQLLTEVKQNRNKKIRRTSYSFFLAVKKIASFLKKKRIFKINTFVKPRTLSSYHSIQLCQLFYQHGITIDRIKVLLNLSHGKPDKTKKVRRL